MKRLALTCALILPAFAVQGAAAESVTATLQGEGISGTVEMTETASGVVHVVVNAEGLPAGKHGFHVHETGSCEADGGFKSAGGHLAGDKEHGINSSGGPHPGDLPNIHVGEDGILQAEFFARGFTIGEGVDERLLDDDGAAVIIHAGADDYSSQPSGDAGDRLACGVLARKS
ncbi:superoxide dismutase family protein [Roseibium salinum]|uniref:Superoxide dismutase family protein n=1 Tax=Roseibium salinum TaxID=1604349 RepID=A0ABT3QXG3_9HYPH|nr:superoxide dismutase family protein [Roseibium sp. DSM 29163]MCX2721633.1 superoxide dismutase family protein [Roseibium sp. DSM 29163]MDN3722098.1 superoxide dismutase family protein [Roseibium salinum]